MATDPSTAATPPTASLRTDLMILRATLVAFGVPIDAVELRAYDRWARWSLARIGDTAKSRASVAPLQSYSDARHLALDLSLRVQRTAAGKPDDERDAVFARCHAAEDVVRALLWSTTMKRRRAPSAPTTPATAPAASARP
jgi:hypothetical protein